MTLHRNLVASSFAACLLFVCAIHVDSAAQQSQSVEPLAITTVTLPRPDLRHQYYFRLDAQGGVAPLDWELVRGQLPPGLELSRDGVLSGVPTELGEFHFMIAVIDSARPAHQRNHEFTLRVITPLLAKWSRVPAVNGMRIEGAVAISNGSEHDFDLTFVAVAVNESGRATALGYQHFTLKRNTDDLEISFGQTLPAGVYQVNVDVVAEVAKTNAIYRVHLDRPPLQIVQEP